MRILVTNDDGFDAPGLKALADTFTEKGHTVYVVAPAEEKSGASHSITIHKPLRVEQRDKNRWAVEGTPVDCVFLAREVLIRKPVDLVVSGINRGQNMGEDIFYSGTVSAAFEAMFLGLPAIAVSLCGYNKKDFESYLPGAKIVSDIIDQGVLDILDFRGILNINVPDIPDKDIRGIQLSRPGTRTYTDFVQEKKDANGFTTYWIGGNIPEWISEPGTDYHAIDEGYVSISPLEPDLSLREVTGNIGNWIEKVNGKHREVGNAIR